MIETNKNKHSSTVSFYRKLKIDASSSKQSVKPEQAAGLSSASLSSKKLEQLYEQTVSSINQLKIYIFHDKNSILAKRAEAQVENLLTTINNKAQEKLPEEKIKLLYVALVSVLEKELDVYAKTYPPKSYEDFVAHLNAHKNGFQYARLICYTLKDLLMNPELNNFLPENNEFRRAEILNFEKPIEFKEAI